MTKSPAPPLNIYAENIRNGNAAYQITAEAIEKALKPLGIEYALTLRYQDEPDPSMLGQADCYIAAAFDPRARIPQLSQVRLIHCLSAGVERYLPLDWIPGRAFFTNSSGVHAAKAGEFGLLALLMLNDHIPEHSFNQRRHAWGSTLSTPIAGKTAMIYGVGAIGGAIATKAKSLGVRVIGVTHEPYNHPDVDRMIRPHGVRDALPETDFVVVCCPLTDATRGAIGAHEFACIKKGAGLANIARAPIVDYEAMAHALEDGRLSGAVIDVFDEEPLPADSKWWEIKNLLVMPHVAADDPTHYLENALSIFADNAARLLRGAPLRNVIDRERGY